MIRWEYAARANCATTDLNELGADGWELAAAVYDTDRLITVLYFKRPVGGA